MTLRPIVLVDASVHCYNLLEAATRGNVDKSLLPKWAYANWIMRLANPLQLRSAPDAMLVIVCDNKVNGCYWRHKHAQQWEIAYKGNRGPKPEEFEIIKSVLFSLADIWQYPEMEADDLIAEFRRLHVAAGSKRKVYISSIDYDLLQLVDQHFTHVTTGPWEPRVKGITETLDYIEKKHKIRLKSIQTFAQLKTIAGDQGDNLPPGCDYSLVDLIEPPHKYTQNSSHDLACSWDRYGEFAQLLETDKPNPFVPLRKSALNWLLKNNLPLASF